MAQMSSRGTQLFCSLFIVIGLIVFAIGVWTLIKSHENARVVAAVCDRRSDQTELFS